MSEPEKEFIPINSDGTRNLVQMWKELDVDKFDYDYDDCDEDCDDEYDDYDKEDDDDDYDEVTE